MSGLPAHSAAMQQFVDDELLRAPMLFDQLLEGTMDSLRKEMPALAPLQRTAAAELLQALGSRLATLGEIYARSLRRQVQAELSGRPLASQGRPGLHEATPAMLALVDEEEVAVDVELAHAVELIRSVAEAELRELQTYTAALVGDMDVTRDHNPFRAEAHARALWAAAQSLPLTRGQQVQFMRLGSEQLASLLRKSYSASAARLYSQGVEPAAYRTVILPASSRRMLGSETIYGPDLQQVREVLRTVEPAASPAALPSTAPAPGYRQPSFEQAEPLPELPPLLLPGTDRDNAPATRRAPARPRRSASLAPTPPVRVDARSAALVRRLFEAIRADQRVPQDVLAIILRLQPAAMRLAQVEAERLADEMHPLWEFVNRLAYEAEMMPDKGDPERLRFLRLSQQTIDQLAADPQQTAALYVWGLDRLETWLRQRLARRCSAAASQIGALQKLEDKLMAGQMAPTTLSGALDVSQLDTVPAELMADPPPPSLRRETEDWLDELAPGTWLRLFLQGQWVQAQLLWPGERRELWLLGDGASDATWAIRRRALAQLYEARLLKTLTQRSLVRRAAGLVHAQERARAA